MKSHGRIMLITGATDGLGRRVAERLAANGYTLLLHGRNPAKGRAVQERIRADTGNRHLHYYNAYFSSLAAVRALATAVSADWPHLDLLVNNAGLGAGSQPSVRDTSCEGYELRFTVNYLAPFLLTRLLLPLLRRGAVQSGEARIVNVASGAQQAIDFSDPMLEHEYTGMRAYSQSKLALIMFTFDLAQELAGSGVTVNALHPASLMDTKMVREWFGTPRTTVDEGARAVEHLALDEDLKGVNGEYYEGQRRAEAVTQAYDLQARRKLRQTSERWVGFDQ
jgi:NAD(P)-dependent dehydrogenase (short-subunit alcohol dehydrogenase family)